MKAHRTGQSNLECEAAPSNWRLRWNENARDYNQQASTSPAKIISWGHHE
jgi:hypothetical protein